MLESLKIILTCVVAAIIYGIIHDQFTAHICVEYFSVFHPPVFPTQSPTLLAFGWGILATWWVGAFLGVLLAIAARAGTLPKLTSSALIRPIGKLLLVMAVCAALSGATGFALSKNGVIFPPRWIAASLPAASHPRFLADCWAHNASYASGFFGGTVLCVVVFRRRRFGPTHPPASLATGRPSARPVDGERCAR
jgi:hypothetical protein